MEKNLLKNERGLFVMDRDVLIEKAIVLIDNNGNIVNSSNIIPNKTYTAKEKYVLLKGFSVLAYFDTKREAVQAIEKIYYTIETQKFKEEAAMNDFLRMIIEEVM